MFKDFSLSATTMGALAALVGTASSFTIILHGLRAVGATEAQAACGLMAAAIAMGVGAVIMSAWKRIPISWAWTTPGAVLLGTMAVPEGGFGEAVGAFLVCAALLTINGLVKPFGRAVAAIPTPISAAMLGGILLTLCLAPVKAIAYDPLLGLIIFATWLIAGRFNKLFAVPAALIAFILIIIFAIDIPEGSLAALGDAVVPNPQFVTPIFTLTSAISIGFPLFVVTMASQNIPGIAVLKLHEYEKFEPGPSIAMTGLFSALAAPFGGVAVNLAAITAAMCMGNEAHPDRDKRYWAAIMGGVFYTLFGLGAGLATAFIVLAPPILIEAVAGLALVGTFATSLNNAFKEPEGREAAAVTFLFTASGVSFFGISGAFWGLLAGLGVHAVMKLSFSK